MYCTLYLATSEVECCPASPLDAATLAAVRRKSDCVIASSHLLLAALREAVRFAYVVSSRAQSVGFDCDVMTSNH